MKPRLELVKRQSRNQDGQMANPVSPMLTVVESVPAKLSLAQNVKQALVDCGVMGGFYGAYKVLGYIGSWFTPAQNTQPAPAAPAATPQNTQQPAPVAPVAPANPTTGTP